MDAVVASEVRALARDLDWSAPPLGPVAGRPQSLRSTVRTLLSSQYPMILTGGPAFTQIDNDAYAKLVGARHPAALGGDIRGKTVAVLGLTFKPNTDDMRDAPSINIITALNDMGAKVKAYDPIGMEQAKGMLTGVTYTEDAYSCAQGADALVIVTEWEQFRALDLARLKAAMANPVVVDLRNVYRPDDMRRLGFTYVGVGRPASS